MSTATAVGVYDRPNSPEVTEIPYETGMEQFYLAEKLRDAADAKRARDEFANRIELECAL